jgi:symplekin
MIGAVGSKHMVHLPDMIPCLLHLLNDDTPAVARQAIKTGTTLFAKVLEHLVIQVTPFPAAPLGGVFQ